MASEANLELVIKLIYVSRCSQRCKGLEQGTTRCGKRGFCGSNYVKAENNGDRNLS